MHVTVSLKNIIPKVEGNVIFCFNGDTLQSHDRHHFQCVLV